MNADTLIQRIEATAKAYAPNAAGDCAAYEIGLLRGVLREKLAELAVYTGEDKKRRDVTKLSAGDAEVLAAYDYQRAEAPVLDVESPVCGPGCEASVTVYEVLINGAWVDPRDVFDEGLVERWEQQLLQQLEDA